MHPKTSRQTETKTRVRAVTNRAKPTSTTVMEVRPVAPAVFKFKIA